MPKDDFLNFLLDQLAPLREVEPKKMFGGVGLYCDGVFFGILWQDRLFFKTDDQTRGAYEAEGMACFNPSPQTALTTYYELPPGVLDNRHQLCDWAQAAIAAQRRAQQSSAKPAPRKKSAQPQRARSRPKKSPAQPRRASKKK